MYQAIAELLERPFVSIPDLVQAQGRVQPDAPALVQDGRSMNYRELNQRMDRVAAALQRDGIMPGEAISICATTSLEYATVFLGALRAGVIVAPLAPSTTADGLAVMTADAEARLLFVDAGMAEALASVRERIAAPFVMLDDAEAGQTLSDWLAPEGVTPTAVDIQPDWALNIIYSSGTTGTPKGIVQPYGMRLGHVRRGVIQEYGPGASTLLSTPLYSNTTLVPFFQAVSLGACVVLLAKFDAAAYLALAERYRVTHTTLVPVQYRRIMALPDFDRYDLSSFRYKFCTSSPFPAELMADVLKRWPGALLDVYGMTEGGGVCTLEAHKYPDKLHTVGKPVEGHDIRLVDEDGREVPPGGTGEVVGHSGAMMLGYRNQPQKTAEAEWRAPDGKRFMRTGDIGRFDEDGFLLIVDRKKDMIISGGFNIFPSDIEEILRQHPDVAEAAVVGVSSERWGETPVGFMVAAEGASPDPAAVMAWVNDRVGKTQRLAALELVDALPRRAIGKVLKRELRDRYLQTGER
ncbi:MAG: acyl--CoA ligase [Ectothiorhodospiraceae bacterium]|nr:acyl--CoA ligase [Ectothiorhodospiraceae bacterium]